MTSFDARTQSIFGVAVSNEWPLPVTDGDALTPAVIEWLTQPGPRDPSGISRYLSELWRERADLRETFPGIAFDRVQRDEFLAWADAFALQETGADPKLIPSSTNRASATSFGSAIGLDTEGEVASFDVTVVGYLRAQLGLGAAGRRLVRLCEAAGIRVQSIPYDQTASPLTVSWPDAPLESLTPTDITVLCVNAEELPRLARALGPTLLGSTYRIGLWFWELDTLPDRVELTAAFNLVDEIWVTTEFVAGAFRKRAIELGVSTPVNVIQLGVDLTDSESAATSADLNNLFSREEETAPSSRLVDRVTLGFPPGFVIGCVFDYASTLERKNPLGVVQAFRQAFPLPFELGPDLGPWLVFKTSGSSEFDNDRERIRQAIDNRRDIITIDRNFSASDQHGLYRKLDAFISLHRSEGYGLGPLEAMANGVPTIATAYSGNLSFMNESNSWLVPWTPGSVPEGCGQYPPRAMWAEPDVGVAAQYLRHVVLDHQSATVRSRAERGRSDVSELVAGSLAGAWLLRRISEIREVRKLPD